MKRSIKWLLALLGVIAAIVGIMIGAAFVRAHQIIQENLRDARSILETFPSGTTTRPPIFDPEEPGSAWELVDEADTVHDVSGTPVKDVDYPSLHRITGFPTETYGASETEFTAGKVQKAEPQFELIRRALHRRDVSPKRRPGAATTGTAKEALRTLEEWASLAHSRGEDRAAMERLVLAVGWMEDIARCGDTEHMTLLMTAELNTAWLARSILADYSFSVADLEIISRWLDRLAAARPSLQQAIRVNAAIERLFVVDPGFMGYTYASDGLAPTSPTWRELWSTTIHNAARVQDLVRSARALEGLDSLPPWKRHDVAHERLDQLPSRVCEPWELPDETLYLADGAAQLQMTLLRVAVAAAWYEGEQGSFPQSLVALVPRYLSSVPLCPVTGSALQVERGRVSSKSAATRKSPEEPDYSLSPEDVEWTIHRKK